MLYTIYWRNAIDSSRWASRSYTWEQVLYSIQAEHRHTFNRAVRVEVMSHHDSL